MARALDLKAVESKVSFKETRIRELIAAGRFPIPHKLGGRKLCWLEEEIDNWLVTEFSKRNVRRAG